MRKPIIIALALMAAFAGVRCTTDGEGGERARLTEPPVLPSAASMAIPQFAETTGAEKSGAGPIAFMNAGADGKSGSWVFNDVFDHKAKYGFKYALTDASGDVKAENLDADSPSFGSYLQWKSEGQMRYFEGYDAAKKDATLISYNSITGAGKLKDVDEGTTRCWDSRLAWYRDIDCAQLSW